MIFREFKLEDLESVQELHKQFNYPMIDVTNPIYLTKGIIESNGKIIAFGTLKLLAEAITLVDYNASPLIRLNALKSLFEQAKFRTRILGLDEIIACVYNDTPKTFIKILEQEFGFSKCTGQVLTQRLSW